MKRIVILLAVLAGLVGLVLITQSNQNKRMNKGRTVGAPPRELLFPNLDVNAIQKIQIKDKDGAVSLAVAGDKWVVNERSGYPASFEKISRVIMELREQKIARGQQAGKSAWGEIKVRAPGEGNPDEQGLGVDFQDARGNPLKSFILGGNVESSGGRNANPMFGNMSNERFVRIPEDSEKDTIWVVGNTFTDLQPKPDQWIDKAFIDVQKLAGIEVTPPGGADAWKASRKDEQTPWALADAKADEALDDGKASISGLLSNPTFIDVLPKDKATPDFMKDAIKAKLTTLDGFTYDLQLLKTKAKDSTDELHYLTVKVAADLPKERKAGKDEKEEDKKKKDEEFAAEKKKLEEKLAKEKKMEGWVYNIGSYTVTALLKKRSEVLKDKPAAPAADPAKPAEPGAAATPPPPAPPAPPAATQPPVSVTTKPITVTTPPIAVPPLPKTEVKPAPAPNENPAQPGTPVPPAPKPEDKPAAKPDAKPQP